MTPRRVASHASSSVSRRAVAPTTTPSPASSPLRQTQRTARRRCRTCEGVGELGEQRRVGREIAANLQDMRLLVQPDAPHPGGPHHRDQVEVVGRESCCSPSASGRRRQSGWLSRATTSGASRRTLRARDPRRLRQQPRLRRSARVLTKLDLLLRSHRVDGEGCEAGSRLTVRSGRGSSSWRQRGCLAG
jgi:hypothetical protein